MVNAYGKRLDNRFYLPFTIVLQVLEVGTTG